MPVSSPKTYDQAVILPSLVQIVYGGSPPSRVFRKSRSAWQWGDKLDGTGMTTPSPRRALRLHCLPSPQISVDRCGVVLHARVAIGDLHSNLGPRIYPLLYDVRPITMGLRCWSHKSPVVYRSRSLARGSFLLRGDVVLPGRACWHCSQSRRDRNTDRQRPRLRRWLNTYLVAFQGFSIGGAGRIPAMLCISCMRKFTSWTGGLTTDCRPSRRDHACRQKPGLMCESGSICGFMSILVIVGKCICEKLTEYSCAVCLVHRPLLASVYLLLVGSFY